MCFAFLHKPLWLCFALSELIFCAIDLKSVYCSPTERYRLAMVPFILFWIFIEWPHRKKFLFEIASLCAISLDGLAVGTDLCSMWHTWHLPTACVDVPFSPALIGRPVKTFRPRLELVWPHSLYRLKKLCGLPNFRRECLLEIGSIELITSTGMGFFNGWSQYD